MEPNDKGTVVELMGSVPKIWSDHVLDEIYKPNPFISMITESPRLTGFQKIKNRFKIYIDRIFKALRVLRGDDE